MSATQTAAIEPDLYLHLARMMARHRYPQLHIEARWANSYTQLELLKSESDTDPHHPFEQTWA